MVTNTLTVVSVNNYLQELKIVDENLIIHMIFMLLQRVSR